MDYRGDPLVTASGSPTTLTPSISTGGTGTQLSTTTASGGISDLAFFSAVPTTVHSDIYAVTTSGAATVTFTFATAGCDTQISWITANGYCAANFDFDNVVLTLLALPPVAGLLPADAPKNAGNAAEAIDPFTADLGAFPAKFVDLYALSTTDQVNALLQISGELGMGVQQSRYNADDAFMGAMFANGLGADDQGQLEGGPAVLGQFPRLRRACPGRCGHRGQRFFEHHCRSKPWGHQPACLGGSAWLCPWHDALGL